MAPTLRPRPPDQQFGKPALPPVVKKPRQPRKPSQKKQPTPPPDPETEPEREPEEPERDIPTPPQRSPGGSPSDGHVSDDDEIDLPAPIVEQPPAQPPAPPRTPDRIPQTPRRGSGLYSPYPSGSVGNTPNEAKLQRTPTPRKSPPNRAEGPRTPGSGNRQSEEGPPSSSAHNSSTGPRTPGGSNRGSGEGSPSPGGRPSPGSAPHTPERPRRRHRAASYSPTALLNAVVGPLIGQRPKIDEEVEEEDEEESDQDYGAGSDAEHNSDDYSEYEGEENVLSRGPQPWHNWRRNLAILLVWLLTVFLAIYYMYPGCRWWRSSRYSFRETVWPTAADMRFLRGAQWRGPPGSYEALRFHPVLQ